MTSDREVIVLGCLVIVNDHERKRLDRYPMPSPELAEALAAAIRR
jgi:hypothetical protein